MRAAVLTEVNKPLQILDLRFSRARCDSVRLTVEHKHSNAKYVRAGITAIYGP